ncbi:MAG: hypothetical protein AB7G28_26055 [Pirellulales bacterium]
MTRGQAFLVVGHKQWGKSRTLKSLTNESHQLRSISIADRHVFIRRMSNDDRPSDFRNFVQELRPATREHAIMAFCPVFDKDADEILRDLKNRYDIYAFVLRHSFDGERQISTVEIDALQEYATVEVFDRKADCRERAGALRKFIERHIR